MMMMMKGVQFCESCALAWDVGRIVTSGARVANAMVMCSVEGGALAHHLVALVADVSRTTIWYLCLCSVRHFALHVHM